MRIRNFAFSLTLCLAASSAFAQSRSTTRLDLLGDPAPLSAAQRTIVIKPDTRYVNVTGGEIIQFQAGDQRFAWQFDVAMTVNSFNLNQVAPVGALTHKVTANIQPDPKYRNP